MAGTQSGGKSQKEWTLYRDLQDLGPGSGGFCDRSLQLECLILVAWGFGWRLGWSEHGTGLRRTMVTEALGIDRVIKAVPGSLTFSSSNSWSKMFVAATVGTKTFDVSRVSIELLGSRCHTFVEGPDIFLKLSPDIPRHLSGKQIIGSDLSGVRQKDNESRKARPEKRCQKWSSDRSKPRKVIPEPRKPRGNT